VFDHRDRAVLRRAARLARRSQPARPQLAGERRIGAVVAQLAELVEQRGGPQVRVLGQPFPAVVDERLERIRFTALALPGDPAAVQIGADGLAVMAQVPGDRGDRPAPAVQRTASTSSSRVSMSAGGPFELRVIRNRQPRRNLRRLGGATRVGNFSEQLWGDSPERRQLRAAPVRATAPARRARGVRPRARPVERAEPYPVAEPGPRPAMSAAVSRARRTARRGGCRGPRPTRAAGPCGRWSGPRMRSGSAHESAVDAGWLSAAPDERPGSLSPLTATPARRATRLLPSNKRQQVRYSAGPR
jgi:hypothetical protein